MSLFNPRSHTLYVTAQGLIALTHQRNHIEVAARFEAPEEEIGHAISDSPAISDFQHWVSQHRNDVFNLLIDHVDEQQLIEDIPRLGSRDRETLILKRAAQRFRDSEFIMHQLIERVSDQKRKQHRIAMMALKASVPVAPWLDVLLEQQVRIRRVTSPSLLADPLMRRFAPGQTGLLVSRNPAGLRQTLLINGSVRFSRLARLKAFDTEQVSGEVQRSLQYLIMTQRLTRAELDNQAFRVWIIDDGIAGAATFPSQLKLDSGAELSIRLLNPPRLGLPTLPDDFALGLWTAVAMRLAGKRDYGNARTSLYDQIHRWKIRLWSGSVAVAVIGGLMTFSVDRAVQHTIPDTKQTRIQTSHLSEEIRALEATVATYPLPPQDLKSSVAIARRIRSNETDLVHLFSSIAAAWRGNTGLTLTELSFEPLAPPTEQFTMTGGTGQNRTASTLLNGNKRFLIAGSTNKTLSRSLANDQIQSLAARLAQHCECSIDEVVLPHDPSPNADLTGLLPAANAKPGEFRIAMIQHGHGSQATGPDAHETAVHPAMAASAMSKSQ